MQFNLSSRGLWHIMRSHYDIGLRSDIVDAIEREGQEAGIDDEGNLQVTMPAHSSATADLRALASSYDTISEVGTPLGAAAVRFRIAPAEDRMAYM